MKNKKIITQKVFVQEHSGLHHWKEKYQSILNVYFSLGQKKENQRGNTMRPQHINKSQQFCCFLKNYCRPPGSHGQRTHLKGQKLTKNYKKIWCIYKIFCGRMLSEDEY